MAAFSATSGFPSKWELLMWLLLSCNIVLRGEADSFDVPVGSFSLPPAKAPLAAPVLPSMLYGSQKRHASPHMTRILASSPVQAPYNGPVLTTGHPPDSSRSSKSLKKSKVAPPVEGQMPPQLGESAPALSKLPEPPLSPEVSNCCGPDMVFKRESRGCHCVYPIKVDLLLLNVSENPNWSVFLQDFASGLEAPCLSNSIE